MKRTITFCSFVLLLPVLFATWLLSWHALPERAVELSSRLKTDSAGLYLLGDQVNMELLGDGQFFLTISNRELSDFRFLFFEDVQSDDLYQIKLLWKQDNQLLFEQSVRRGLNDFSVVLPEPFAQNTDLDLSIQLSRVEQPGVSYPTEPFSFTRMRLQTDSAQARRQHALNAWFDFVPTSFHSMNFWRKTDALFSVGLLLPIFAYLCLMIGLWRLLKLSGNHLIAAFLLFFMVVSSAYWVNQWRVFRLQQNGHLFDDHLTTVSSIDRELLEVAQKTLATYHQQQFDKPLLIIREDDFERSRLAYHLSSLNVYHMPFIENLSAFVDQYGYDYWLLIEAGKESCRFDLINSVSLHYQLLWQQQGYCLLRL